MNNLFTKEIIELSAQSATILQLNTIIKARDMRIVELEECLRSVVYGNVMDDYGNINPDEGLKIWQSYNQSVPSDTVTSIIKKVENLLER